MSRIVKFLLVLLLGASSQLIMAQDPVFSQYYNAPLQLNPAFAGTSYAPLISINYRNQWPGISAAYSTFSLSYDQFFTNNQIGLGFSILSDAAGSGALKSTKGAGSISYRLRVTDETFLKGGVRLAFVQNRLNWDKLLFYDAIDPQFGSISPGGTPFPSTENEPGNTARYYLDISTGLLLYNEKYYVGASLDHLNTPNDNFLQSESQNYNDLPLRYSIHGGYQFNLSNKYSNNTFITPNILLTGQASFFQINAGAYLSKESLFGGLWYRHAGGNGDAVIGSFGVRTGMFKISYSYDYTISGLTISSGGAHELGLIIDLKDYYPKESKMNDCLLLFR